MSEALDTEAQALVAKGGVYRVSAASAAVGRSMLLAAGGRAAIQGTMAGLGSLAAQGGAIGQAATITRAGAEVGLAAAAARSAGDNLGTPPNAPIAWSATSPQPTRLSPSMRGGRSRSRNGSVGGLKSIPPPLRFQTRSTRRCRRRYRIPAFFISAPSCSSSASLRL